MEWELTDEEIEKIYPGASYWMDYPIFRTIAQAQAKKLVERLEAPCLIHLHGRDNPKETSKHCRLCSTCMRELRRQVGLE